MKWLIAIFALAVTVAAQPFVPQSDRNPPTGYWQTAGAIENADGPIVNMVTTYGADPTGATDTSGVWATATLAAALANNATVLYFPAGTYKFTSTIVAPFAGLNGYGNWKVRGAVNAYGAPAVTFDDRVASANHRFLVIGEGIEWGVSRPKATITAGLTKGSNHITVSSNPGFTGYGTARIVLTTDPTREWFVYDSGGDLVRFWCTRLTGVSGSGASTVLTLEDVLPETYSSTETTGAYIQQYEFGIFYDIVIENIIIDGSNSGGMQYGVWVNCNTHNSIFRNLWIGGHSNYAFFALYATHLTIEDCWIKASNFAGTNHSGLLLDTVSNSKIINNILDKNQPAIELNQGNTGNVYAYNCLPDTVAGLSFDGNHGPTNQYNLIEGNYSPTFQYDGYYGGIRSDLVYRNTISGNSPTDGETFGFSFKRFTRNVSIVGNILGTTGRTQNGLYDFGGPNQGNPGHNGTAHPSTGSYWIDTTAGVPHTWHGILTTRTDSINGYATLDSGGGATMQIHKDHSQSNIAGTSGQQITIGTISGEVIQLINAAVPLPALNADIYFQVSNDGFQELDQDVFRQQDSPVAGTTYALGNYNFFLGQIPSDEALGGTTLPNSFFLTGSLDHIGNLTFPPYDPTAPGTPTTTQAMNKIPAGYRYNDANHAWPGGSPPVGGGTLTITNKLTITGAIKFQ